MSVSSAYTPTNPEVCDMIGCIPRPAHIKCTNCESNVCIWCSKQGFECLGCHQYYCKRKKCASKVKKFYCNQCEK